MKIYKNNFKIQYIYSILTHLTPLASLVATLILLNYQMNKQHNCNFFYGYDLGVIARQFQNVNSSHSRNWSMVCKVISGFDSDAQKVPSFPKIMLNCFYVRHELVVKLCWNMLAQFYLHVTLFFLVQSCLNFR